HFLFKVELDRGPGDHSVSDFELAARLSYFLWSSQPDEELFRVAASGALRRGGTPPAPVPRLLRGPKARAPAEEVAPRGLQSRRTPPGSPTSTTTCAGPCPGKRKSSSTTSCAPTAACWTCWTPATPSSTSGWPGTTASPASGATSSAA